MCGIVGAVLKDPGSINDHLITQLKKLEYRGYDSCGVYAINTLVSDSEVLHRSIGDISRLSTPSIPRLGVADIREFKFTQGIAHTRWATHGAVTVENSHPQVSNDRIFVVHNGVVDNYLQVKDSLVKAGYVFKSETDTEVISHLLHFYVTGLTNVQYQLSTAVLLSLMDLKGKFSFIVIDSQTKTMIAVNQGRPLIVFRNSVGTYLASDLVAFEGMPAGEIYHVPTGETVELNDNVQKLRRVLLDEHGVRTQEKVIEFTLHEPISSNSSLTMRTLMEGEIYQQPQVIRDTLEKLAIDEIAASLHSMIGTVNNVKITLVGCGTSYHAAQVGARWLQSVARVEAKAVVSSEFSNITSPDDSDLFVFISQSGETADTLAAIEQVSPYAQDKTVSICNVPHSEIVRRCSLNLPIVAGVERSVASTKAFTAQLIALLKLSLSIAILKRSGMGEMPWIAQDIEHEMSHLPSYAHDALNFATNMVKVLVDSWSGKSAPKVAIFLGRDSLYPIALEGALKLTEITYIPALTYFTGELKHGPLALIEKNTPVFVVLRGSETNIDRAFSSLKQIEARGGRIHLISDQDGVDKALAAGVKFVLAFQLPLIHKYSSIFLPVIAMLPLQLIAHEIAIKLSRNVDKPRNLAKSVTIS